MTESAEPVRIERDGDVAVVVLDNPPLNLFDPGDVQRPGARRGRTRRSPTRHAGRARAVLFEARGKVVSGGVDVAFFRRHRRGP